MDGFEKKMHEAANALRRNSRLIPLAEIQNWKGIAYVEDVGMFVLRDYAYGVRDLDMEELKKRWPGKRVYFIGSAEAL